MGPESERSRFVYQNSTLDSFCPTRPAKIAAIMNMSNAIERIRNFIRRQHKSLSTDSSYVYGLRQYVTALTTMPDSLPSEQKLERFLTRLACRRHGVAFRMVCYSSLIF
jgi:hypothetical protein